MGTTIREISRKEQPKFLVDKIDLEKPKSIYTETYSDPSERGARMRCDAIADKLVEEKINYAAWDGDYYFSIFVSEKDYDKAKAIIAR